MKLNYLFFAAAIGACGADMMAARDMDAPFLEAGPFVGRDGAAFGPGLILQENVGRVECYEFAGTSSVTGYETGDGVKANFSDRTVGAGIGYRIMRFGPMTLGAYLQVAYYGSRVHARYFDPDYAANVDYRSSDREFLATLGPEFSFDIFPGVRAIIRPGKDFGNNFAAQTAGGFSVNGAILFDAVRGGTVAARGFKKGFSGIARLLH